MECPSCKEDVVRKDDKFCPKCGATQHGPHEVETKRLRDENAALKTEKEKLEKELADERKKTKAGNLP